MTVMKTCASCRRRRIPSAFNKNVRTRDGLQRFCKKCQSDNHRAWAKSDAGRASRKRRRQLNVKKLNAVVRSEKNKPCADCGRKYPFYVMDYDHVRDVKKFNIGEWSHRGGQTMSIKTLLAEIAKCDAVCSNCHRERTWLRRTRRCPVVQQ